MRVLLDCRMAYWSGVGRYTRGLVRALAELPDLELTLVNASAAAPILPEADNVKSISATAGPLSLGGMRELASIAEHQRPDLVHCLHFPTPWSVDYPLVVTLHDLTPLVVPGVMGFPKQLVYRELNRRAVRRASRIITPSDATARDVLRLFPASQGKLVAIAEAADDFSAGEVAEKLPPGMVPSAAPYILAMGNTKAHKDLPALIDAFQRLAPNRPRLQLVLVGDEPRGYLDEKVIGEPRKRARFTGPVSDDQLRALYKGATVFAFPSVYEGFGLPPLEAMAMGAPVVAAKAASVPEVVGDAALLVPPSDPRALLNALARLLDDSALREDLSAKGRARAREFTWARTARQTCEVYREVLGR